MEQRDLLLTEAWLILYHVTQSGTENWIRVTTSTMTTTCSDAPYFLNRTQKVSNLFRKNAWLNGLYFIQIMYEGHPEGACDEMIGLTNESIMSELIAGDEAEDDNRPGNPFDPLFNGQVCLDAHRLFPFAS